MGRQREAARPAAQRCLRVAEPVSPCRGTGGPLWRLSSAGSATRRRSPRGRRPVAAEVVQRTRGLPRTQIHGTGIERRSSCGPLSCGYSPEGRRTRAIRVLRVRHSVCGYSPGGRRTTPARRAPRSADQRPQSVLPCTTTHMPAAAHMSGSFKQGPSRPFGARARILKQLLPRGLPNPQEAAAIPRRTAPLMRHGGSLPDVYGIAFNNGRKGEVPRVTG